MEETWVALPDKTELIDHGTHAEIVVRWLGWQGYALTLAFFFFLIPFKFINFSSDSLLENFAWLFLLGAETVLGYCTAAYLLNQTHIVAGGGWVSLRQGPVPWLGNIEIETSNLQQLYVEERGVGQYGGPPYVYDIQARLHERHNVGFVRGLLRSLDEAITYGPVTEFKVKFVRGLKTRGQAQFIEQKFEEFLGIEDDTSRVWRLGFS